MPTNKKKGKARGSLTGGRGRGRARNIFNQPADLSFVPRQKVVATAATTRHGRPNRKTEKALENSLQVEDVNDDPDGEYVLEPLKERRGPGRPPRQQSFVPEPAFTLSLNLPELDSPPPTSDLTIEVNEDITSLFTAINDEVSIVTELPSLVLPSPIDPDIDIEQPWTSANLFHVYILGYSRRAYHLCDLIVDTWIREFHKIDDTPRCKIWRINKSKYKSQDPVPDNDNGDPNIDIHATDFDSNRMRELYENTGPDCGARFLWADAMALCGSLLENRLDEQGGVRNWPSELIWDVMRTSLRLTRVRRTLKVEERVPSAWCDRYHEHGKHGLPCYREIAAEQKAEAKEKRKEHRRRTKSTDRESEQEGDVQMMELHDPQGPAGSGKQVSFVEGNEARWREESEEA